MFTESYSLSSSSSLTVGGTYIKTRILGGKNQWGATLEADCMDAQRKSEVDLAPGRVVHGSGEKGREVGIRPTPLPLLPSSSVTYAVEEKMHSSTR